MKESRKEFIKELHSVVGTVWQTSIEKEFPKLFKEDDLVVGKWYKHYSGGSNYLVCVIDKKTAYGFMGERYSKSLFFGKHRLSQGAVRATDEEVKKALIKEAKKRGFKKGCEYIGVRDLTIQKATKNIDVWNCNSCIEMGFDYVFLDGKWATIIETITKEQAEKELGKTIIN
tara:strand:+ start:908 stop:1423 length:516 start_codon:yes stop_codon:yes gene_type:complete